MSSGEGMMDRVRTVVFQRSSRRPACSHLGSVDVKSTDDTECHACVEEETVWVHLRMCLSCGEVGCCDSSPGTHARRHHEQTGHALIRSIEPNEKWIWCYPDGAYVGKVRG